MSHTKGKVVLDHSIRTAINMADPPYQHIAMVNITQNKNYTITKEEHEDNSRRIAALWNMAERLDLTTEEIEGIASDTNSEATVECFLGCPKPNDLMKKYMRKQYGRTR